MRPKYCRYQQYMQSLLFIGAQDSVFPNKIDVFASIGETRVRIPLGSPFSQVSGNKQIPNISFRSILAGITPRFNQFRACVRTLRDVYRCWETGLAPLKELNSHSSSGKLRSFTLAPQHFHVSEAILKLAPMGIPGPPQSCGGWSRSGLGLRRGAGWRMSGALTGSIPSAEMGSAHRRKLNVY